VEFFLVKNTYTHKKATQRAEEQEAGWWNVASESHCETMKVKNKLNEERS
jgi:hypothetical protein